MRLFGILLCSSCIVAGGSYADKVKHLLETHFTYKNNTCWQKATSKAKDFKDTDDMIMAITLVNIYTQQCNAYATKDDDKGPFYAELNRQLRAKTVENIWLETEKLLNTGLEMIGLQTWSFLYRSCACNTITKGAIIEVNDFWSISSKAGEANEFLDKTNIFFMIKDARNGADIRKYSEYHHEKEVLLQSNSKFRVEEYAMDPESKATQREHVNKINGMSESDWKEMKGFAVVTVIIPKGKRSTSQSNYCDCSGGKTSDASLPSSVFGALFFIAFGLVCVYKK